MEVKKAIGAEAYSTYQVGMLRTKEDATWDGVTDQAAARSTSYKNGHRDAVETIRSHFRSRLESTAINDIPVVTLFSPQEGHEEEYIQGYRDAINETRQRVELDYNSNLRKHEARGKVMRRITEIFEGTPEFRMRLDRIRLAVLDRIEAKLGLD